MPSAYPVSRAATGAPCLAARVSNSTGTPGAVRRSAKGSSTHSPSVHLDLDVPTGPQGDRKLWRHRVRKHETETCGEQGQQELCLQQRVVAAKADPVAR